jgi:uncharacterized membrane protein YkoI
MKDPIPMNNILRFVVLLLLFVAPVSFGQQAKLRRELAHVPPPVRKTIRAHLGEDKFDNVEKNDDEGEITYDVEFTRNGVERGFTVAANGELLDEEVFFKELPQAVQDTIQRKAAGATPGEIDKSNDDGETTFDINVTRAGHERDFTVDEDGGLLTEQVFLNELPPVVQTTIRKQAGSGGLGEIEKSADDGEISYDIDMTNSTGKTVSFTVDGKGQLDEVEISMSDLPGPVQTAVQKEAAGAEPDDIKKSFEDGETNFVIDLTANDRTRTLTFDADGKLESQEEDVALGDAPDPVRQQIADITGQGKVLGLTKITEDGEVTYEADLQNGSSDKTVTVAADGKILPDDSN